MAKLFKRIFGKRKQLPMLSVDERGMYLVASAMRDWKT